jgi:O-acetyl-ADP-ribose deacetylase (regulator of RNase III)
VNLHSLPVRLYQLLASAYRSALKLAEKHGCRIIAFPAISTGIFGCPLHEATDIAVKTVPGFNGRRKHGPAGGLSVVQQRSAGGRIEQPASGFDI